MPNTNKNDNGTITTLIINSFVRISLLFVISKYKNAGGINKKIADSLVKNARRRKIAEMGRYFLSLSTPK